MPGLFAGTSPRPATLLLDVEKMDIREAVLLRLLLRVVLSPSLMDSLMDSLTDSLLMESVAESLP